MFLKAVRTLGCSALALALVAPAVEAQWIEAPGKGWADLTFYHLDTREAYEFDGEVRDFFADGHAITNSGFLTMALGLVRGVDAWAQVAYHRLRFDDAKEDRLRSGIGDSSFHLRVAPLSYLGVDFSFAIRGGVKVALGDFAVDSDIIPLGDGQRD